VLLLPGGQVTVADRVRLEADRRARVARARRNGSIAFAAMNRRPQLELIAPSASPEEAAAVVAALERFMRDHAPVVAPAGPPRNPWQRDALLESAGYSGVQRDPWGDPHPWG
jgi:hypothetical protein